MDILTILPPVLAIGIALWTRNVFWALGAAIWVSEALIVGGNPALGALGAIDRSVDVLTSAGNARILLFCLIIGALIAYMQKSGGIAAMVEKLTSSGVASTRRRAGLSTSIAGIILFVETNISLLTTGIMGRPLFDRQKMSRERLAYIIDSTSAPVSVLIPLNGWGAYALVLISAYEIADPLSVLMMSIPLNFYALATLTGVLATVTLDKTFGPLSNTRAQTGPQDAPDTATHFSFMAVPILILVGGAIGMMAYTGGGNILEGSGSQSILWAIVLATATAFVMLLASKRYKSNELIDMGFAGMGELLPAVTVIFLSLALGASLRALGTGEFIAGLATGFPAPFMFPAILFLSAAATSFATGTSWGTYGLLIPIAIPLAIGADMPPALVLAAVLGGGVFGDHCSPISDTSIIASLAAGCDHIDHVRTQLPYALVAAAIATFGYLIAGAAVIGG
ncbi:MAG: Na+/H+ antiporter NhaC family protein [Pseudomonadota bacterium]